MYIDTPLNLKNNSKFITMKNLFIIFYFIPTLFFAQDKIKGMVMEPSTQGKHLPLAGANVIWEGTSVGTITDIDGNFTLPYESIYKTLVISYVGYKSKTIDIKNPNTIMINIIFFITLMLLFHVQTLNQKED